MIFRDMGTHYEVEMFHVVNIGKKTPELSFHDYLKTLAEEFVAELNTTRFAIKHNIEYKPVTQSHHLITDDGKDIIREVKND